MDGPFLLSGSLNLKHCADMSPDIFTPKLRPVFSFSFSLFCSRPLFVMFIMFTVAPFGPIHISCITLKRTALH
jgi:hypothetical protein